MRPGGAPLWNLAQALVALIGPSADDHARFDSIRKVRQILNRGSTAFREIAETFGLGRNQNVCLLIDQFEGLFRFAREVGREEAETFAEVLSGFQTDLPTGVHVIITMRSDHLGDCGRYLGFAELVNRTQHLLPRMDELSLLRAIREPARLYGGDVSLELALRLIQDTVGEAVALPLAQHCLMRLWQQAKGVGQAGADPLLETRERPDTRRCDWEALRLAATGAGGRPHLAWASSSGGDEHGPVVDTGDPGCVGLRAGGTYLILATVDHMAGQFPSAVARRLTDQTTPYLHVGSLEDALTHLPATAVVIVKVPTPQAPSKPWSRMTASA